MKRLSIRWKLTLWYAGVLAGVLAVFSMAVFFTLRHQLLERIDQGLSEELADVLYEVNRADDSKVLREWLDRRFARHEGFDFQISRLDGARFFVNPRIADRSFPLPDRSMNLSTPTYETVAIETAGRWRVIRVRIQGPDGPLTIQVARSLAAFDHESRELLLAFLLTGPLTLLVAIAGGYVLARRALAPVHTMTQTANGITADRLNQRIEVDNPDDELGALARTLNEMIERLERSFTEMRRFTADAAHELRTPLAVIRNEAEVALRSTRSAEEYSGVLENLLEETNRLTHLADQLLFLCRQDAGLLGEVRETVALDKLLQDVVGNMQLVAQEKRIALLLEENSPCQLFSDGSQLRRVCYNLLDNAIKYTEPFGQIKVSVKLAAKSVVVSIADTGVGIPPEHLPRIFDRFYRVDAARTGEGSGAGLGLAICQSIVRRLGGSIQVESTPGQGTTVVVELRER